MRSAGQHQGESGSRPVLAGLVAIWLILQAANPRFLSAANLTNLTLQIAMIIVIALGVVLVLLAGEIDLSVGATSGLCAALMADLNVRHGVAAPLAILAGLLTGGLIGLVQGLWVVRFRVPSFVVSLAGLLAWQGMLLLVLGRNGTLNLSDPTIVRLAGTFYTGAVVWTAAALLVAGRVLVVFRARQRRAAAGLALAPPAAAVPGLAVTAALAFGAAAVFSADRGLPLAVVLSVGLVAAFDFVLTRTRFGRHLIAVGGNAEASRRAGIPVDRVRLAAFTLGSLLAAAAGILGASRLLAVNQSSGSGDLLLNAVAAAVIGGTSLFGGRGSAWSALLGALVIGSTANGMDLLAVSSSVKFMVTGGVLLVAATVDATSRRRRLAVERI
jgi:D-xylose transport system permease protein